MKVFTFKRITNNQDTIILIVPANSLKEAEEQLFRYGFDYQGVVYAELVAEGSVYCVGSPASEFIYTIE